MTLPKATPTLADLRALDLSPVATQPFGECSRFADWLLSRKNVPVEGTPAWKAHVLVGFVASLRLDPDSDAAPLKKGSWFFDGAGPEALSGDQVAVLEGWLPDVADADLRARVAECLWLVRRPRDHRHGRAALEGYLAAATLLAAPGGHWPDAIERFQRALQLGGKFGETDRVVASIEAALDIAGEATAGPRNLHLMRLLLDRGLSDPSKYGPMAEALAALCEREAVPDRPGTMKLFTAAEYWRAAAEWRARETAPDPSVVQALRVRAAESFVLLADKSRDAGEPMVEAHHLGGAIKGLRDAGAPRERVEALIARMMLAQRAAPRATISHSINITEQVASGKKHVSGKDLPSALQSLAGVTAPPSVSELREMVEEANKKFIAAKLFPTALMSSDDRVVEYLPPLSDENETEEQRNSNARVIRRQMWSHAELMRTISCGYIEGARAQLLLEHAPRVADLMALAAASWLVPPGHEGLFARGLHAGLYGDFVVACHILVPQLENGLRVFVQEALKKPMVSIDTADGTQMVSLLNRLLSLPELENALGKDLIFDLQGLLVMQESVNLRNHLSHGLLGDRAFGVSAIYFWWLCLRICFLLLPKTQSP